MIIDVLKDFRVFKNSSPRKNHRTRDTYINNDYTVGGIELKTQN